MMDVGKYQRIITRYFKRYKSLTANPFHARNICKARLNHLQPITIPIALISQIQRSGGSLLSQLFDGHPELHAHPHELKIGYPKKYHWPKIDINDASSKWFKILFEDSVIRLFENGYKKEPTSKITFPFIFFPYLQKQIFQKYLSLLKDINIRNIFDAYMTSYFNAWLNNQNTCGSKKYITGFTPRLSDNPQNMELFFKIYPDGCLISIIRNPKNWFPSAYRHNEKIKKDKYSDLRIAIKQWKTSTQAAVRNKLQYGDRVCVIRFEDLIKRTELVMRHLSKFLNIKFDNILSVPTFNRNPIQANTSFDDCETGIVKSTLARHKTLAAEENEIIGKMTSDAYKRALDMVINI
jgi:hypothetical protein